MTGTGAYSPIHNKEAKCCHNRIKQLNVLQLIAFTKACINRSIQHEKNLWGHWLWLKFMLLTWRRLSREIQNAVQVLRSPTLSSSLTSVSQASCLG